MLKKISLVTLLVIGGAVYAQADAIANPWEIGVSAAAIFEGNAGDSLDNDFPGVGLRVGYHFTQNWSAVGEILYTNPNYGSQKVDVVDYIGGVNYNFSAINSVIPFASMGFGYRTISDVSNRDDWNFVPGFGFKMPINDSFQIMIEGKGRWNLEESEQGMLGTAGVNYFF